MIRIPEKLKSGDHVRVIAPSSSLSIISPNVRSIANQRFEELGLRLSFGKHVEEVEAFNSASIAARLEDFHEAFADTSVQAVVAVIGGHNANQLLRYIDWNLVRNNPKVFLGFSDTTALQVAILTQSNFVTYSGPAYATFGQELYFDYTLDYFRKCCMQEDSFDLLPASSWTDDLWFLNQKERDPVANEGWLVVQEGLAEGPIIGGNLDTLMLLAGTPYMPNLKEAILMIEDDEESNYRRFDRALEALLSQPGADTIQGILLGRFQKASEVDQEGIKRLFSVRPWLKHIPVIANLDFGHTSPMVTLPLGGRARVQVSHEQASVTIAEH